MDPKHLPKLLLFCLVAGFSVFWGFLFVSTEAAVALVKTYGYWLMVANFLLALWSALKVCKEGRCESGRQHFKLNSLNWRVWALPAIFILGSTWMLSYLQPREYKIIMDEPVLTSTSLRMHEHREVMVTARTHLIGDSFSQLDGYVDKRPYFFPFLLSLVHDLTGYRSENGHWLNLLITPVLLGLLFYFGRLYGPQAGGYLAVSLAVSLPLLAKNVNGAGFELLNLVMIMLTLLASLHYLRKPSESRLDVLVLLAILLAQTRYESAVYLLGVGVIVLASWFREKRIILSWLSLLAPIFCLPIALQQQVFGDYEGLWQLDEGISAPFALGFIPENLKHAATFFFNWGDTQQPNSLLLSCAFVIAVPVMVYYLFFRKRGEAGARPRYEFCAVTLIFFSLVSFNFLLLMSYHWGQIDDIQATRIALPFIFLQILLVVSLVGKLRLRRLWQFAIVSVVWMFVLSVTLPVCKQTNFMERVPGWYRAMWFQGEVNKRAGERVLFVSNRHMVAITEGAAAIPEIFAKKNKSQLHFHHQLGTYDEILFSHMLSRSGEGEAFAPKAPLYEDFELEHISEHQYGRDRMMRISRLIGVKWRENDHQVDLLPEFESLESAEAREAFLAKNLP